ncbi:MAG: histidine phosphatase family protein [Eudoraea sp.]|nr:histidine phosphatase family protein [Eudoraea sp.]
MKTFKLIIFSLLLTLSISCNEDPKETMDNPEPVISTYYFIRHAEKDRSNPENVDPELNQKGLGRAMHWAEILKEVSLDAIYTTDYERTRMTAAPVAIKQEITENYYDPRTLDIEAFQLENLGKNVLVVGHSNSTPDLVNRMIGVEKYESMDDYDNGSLFIVTVVDGKAIDSRLMFNCNCPD